MSRTGDCYDNAVVFLPRREPFPSRLRSYRVRPREGALPMKCTRLPPRPTAGKSSPSLASSPSTSKPSRVDLLNGEAKTPFVSRKEPQRQGARSGAPGSPSSGSPTPSWRTSPVSSPSVAAPCQATRTRRGRPLALLGEHYASRPPYGRSGSRKLLKPIMKQSPDAALSPPGTTEFASAARCSTMRSPASLPGRQALHRDFAMAVPQPRGRSLATSTSTPYPSLSAWMFA